MTPTQRISFHFVAVTALLLPSASGALHAQGFRPVDQANANRPVASPTAARPSPAQSLSARSAMPSQPAGVAGVSGSRSTSMLDQPATPAKVVVTPAGLTIVANNASLTDVIRQVALQTSMQVEGNSREERVFGVYGPGSPPDVLSALLYDSGYNVLMVGSGTDGVPRRLVLSQRAAQATVQNVASAQPSRNADDDDEPEQPEAPPAPPSAPAAQTLQPTQAPAASTPGQVRTPQQMLEELQKMHAGQQPAEVPREPQ